MRRSLSTNLQDRIPETAAAYSRLLLAVGKSGTGKTQALKELSDSDGWPIVNVNLELSEKLLELSKKQRAVRAAALVGDLLSEEGSEAVLLDNIEILFATELAQDPLKLLQKLSRNRTIVAAWPGTFDRTSLTYAEPPHPEYRKYVSPEAVIVTAGEDGHLGENA